MQFIVAMIIMVVVLFGLLQFQLQLGQNLRTGKQKQDCKLSVLAASTQKLLSSDVPFNINCCQQNIIVNDPTKVIPTLANTLYDCYDLFKSADLFTDLGRYCFICSTIQFTDKVSQEEIQGLFRHFFSKKPPRSLHTYAQEIYGERAAQLLQTFQAQKPDFLDTTMPKRDYAVIFVQDRYLGTTTIPPGLDISTSNDQAVAVNILTESTEALQYESVILGAAGPSLPTTVNIRNMYSLRQLDPEDLNRLGCMRQNVVRCE